MLQYDYGWNSFSRSRYTRVGGVTLEPLESRSRVPRKVVTSFARRHGQPLKPYIGRPRRTDGDSC
jgi:hypothetical protein